MKAFPAKLSMLLFLISLIAGFYQNLSVLQNLIRSAVIYLIFSVLILLIYILYHQSTYNMSRAKLEAQHVSVQKEADKDSSTQPE